MRTQTSCAAAPRSAGVLKIVLIVFVLLALLCAGIVAFIATQYRSLLVGAFLPVVQQMVDDSRLPADQKERIKAILETVGKDYRDEYITNAEMIHIGQELSSGSFFTLLQIEMARTLYHKRISEPTEALAAADVTFDAYQRGISEGRIPLEQATAALGLVSKLGQNNKQVIDEQATPEQLKAFVERMAGEVAAAGIPLEIYKVDFAGYLQDAVDRALGRLPSLPPAEAPPTGAPPAEAPPTGAPPATTGE